jgi:hypothetical protein
MVQASDWLDRLAIVDGARRRHVRSDNASERNTLMRSFRTAGSLFLLALMISAVASASALALPEFLGTFPTSLTGTSGTSTLADTASGLTLSCKKDKASGSVTSGTAIELTIDCESVKVGGLAAQSLGDKGGVVLIPLTGVLCYINKSTKEAGARFTLPSGGVHIEVPALGELLLITGTTVGQLTPINTSTTSMTLDFSGKSCEGQTNGLRVEQDHNGEALGDALTSTESLTLSKALTLDA